MVVPCRWRRRWRRRGGRESRCQPGPGRPWRSGSTVTRRSRRRSWSSRAAPRSRSTSARGFPPDSAPGSTSTRMARSLPQSRPSHDPRSDLRPHSGSRRPRCAGPSPPGGRPETRPTRSWSRIRDASRRGSRSTCSATEPTTRRNEQSGSRRAGVRVLDLTALGVDGSAGIVVDATQPVSAARQSAGSAGVTVSPGIPGAREQRADRDHPGAHRGGDRTRRDRRRRAHPTPPAGRPTRRLVPDAPPDPPPRLPASRRTVARRALQLDDVRLVPRSRGEDRPARISAGRRGRADLPGRPRAPRPLRHLRGPDGRRRRHRRRRAKPRSSVPTSATDIWAALAELRTPGATDPG